MDRSLKSCKIQHDSSPLIKVEVVENDDDGFEFEYVQIKEEVGEGRQYKNLPDIGDEEETISVNKSVEKPRNSKLPKITPSLCVICNTGFPTKDLYEEHLIFAHKSDLPYECRFCKKRFKEHANRKRHETIHDSSRYSGPGRFECDICGKLYHLGVSLKSHKLRFHSGYKAPQKPPSKPVIQHHSTRGTKNPNPVTRPKTTHTCTKCERKFEMKCLLQKHMATHTDLRPFACEECGQTFKFRTSLVSHVKRIHQLGRPLPLRPRCQAGEPCVCTKCGKSFSVPNQLLRHMTIHTGERQHECDICGEQFRLADGMRRHRRRHLPPDDSGLRTFVCRICGKTEIRGFSELTNHLKGVHGANLSEGNEIFRTFACGICGKPHYLAIQAITCALLCHDPTTLSQKMFRYKCPECPNDFGYCSLPFLRKHWESCHPTMEICKEFRNNKFYYHSTDSCDLPTVTYNKKKAEELRWGNGVPAEVEVSEIPLFTKLHQLPELHKCRTRLKPRRKVREKLPPHVECETCKLTLLRHNYKRHKVVCRGPVLKQRATTSIESKKTQRSSLSKKTPLNLSVRASDWPAVNEILENKFCTVKLKRLS